MKDIKILTLQNAIKYNGKANAGSILGQILSKNPELRKDVPKTKKDIENIVAEVNKLSLEEQKEELKKLGTIELKKKESDIFPKMPGLKKGIITAFPPEPSKYLHLGHAKSAILNHELAKRHKGKFYFRYDDTNPNLVHKKFYKENLEDLKWLNLNPDKIIYASDYLKKLETFAKQLIRENHAYICTCVQEKVKESRQTGKPCKCRTKNVKENISQWKNFKKNMILRLKIDLKHKNSTMRDPTIYRYINKKHPRKQSKKWPTYDFESPILDSLDKITHRLRTTEFDLRIELHNYIQKILKLPQTIYFGVERFNIIGLELKGRKIREKIENKEISGWDDPSIGTIVALKRRGFSPNAIRDFSLGTGITKVKASLTFDDLIHYNKKYVEGSNRYFFIENPKKVTIKDAPKIIAKVPLHPDHPEKGSRNLKTNGKFLVNDKLSKNQAYRFMNLFNFKNGKFISEEHNPRLKAKVIHWLPDSKDLIHVEILKDNKIIKGLAESSIKKVKLGEVIQFIRFGFCKLDKKGKKLNFIYTHN